jgi:hypothetical protein
LGFKPIVFLSFSLFVVATRLRLFVFALRPGGPHNRNAAAPSAKITDFSSNIQTLDSHWSRPLMRLLVFFFEIFGMRVKKSIAKTAYVATGLLKNNYFSFS